jgi:hypothetical protein
MFCGQLVPVGAYFNLLCKKTTFLCLLKSDPDPQGSLQGQLATSLGRFSNLEATFRLRLAYVILIWILAFLGESKDQDRVLND